MSSTRNGENPVKRVIKDIIAYLNYEAYQTGLLKMHPHISVMSVQETINELVNTNKSLVRFGDGEIGLIRGINLNLQNRSDELVDRLKDILKYSDENMIVAIQDIFDGVDMYIPRTQRFWRDHFLFCRKIYEKYCNPNRVYGSTSFSRCYITIEDKSKCKKWFEDIKKIWNDKDVVVVEGVSGHNGVGNDLLDTSRSVERIICPPSNAFASYDKILEACLEYGVDRLFLLAIGAAAKPLAQDLFRKGYRVIDIGNLDTEYELYLRGAMEKMPIEKRSIITEEENICAGYSKYLGEITKRIV
ncbi:GT-D fold domain-containing glycosyltransferase [Butyrivibrio sp. INlla14]|uniref:GT-D fold domain-containing glycosyltransferase n=1 Tax=Butyrivibrio sp. INlla14 TaxID=1520808 RepID=UPI0008769726|nr:GT-D fold domain-containing glycosyltransferase [Butyrivibrio sp. INlla14]SCY70210.1 glycosyltransferase, SP_1767 family [Butyrivibrio sp. INlla14]